MTAKTKESLHQRTLDLIRKDGVNLLVIYKETDLPYHWLKKFKSEEIKDPSVNRVQKLYEYLASKQLEV